MSRYLATEAAIDKAARLFDAGRVHQTMDGLFFVEGDTGNWKVELRTARNDGPHAVCDCPSYAVYCSHILAAMLHAEARP